MLERTLSSRPTPAREKDGKQACTFTPLGRGRLRCNHPRCRTAMGGPVIIKAARADAHRNAKFRERNPVAPMSEITRIVASPKLPTVTIGRYATDVRCPHCGYYNWVEDVAGTVICADCDTRFSILRKSLRSW
ncbi:MAG: hypothetical protein HYS26_03395 [Candidatus Kaiserbacteria bacterium]|nr:MAG: hypothetical protein HYS26_03395 [Candidatus Kaiserbacteria bacterium]